MSRAHHKFMYRDVTYPHLRALAKAIRVNPNTVRKWRKLGLLTEAWLDALMHERELKATARKLGLHPRLPNGRIDSEDARPTSGENA
jgi:hypothetical protein